MQFKNNENSVIDDYAYITRAFAVIGLMRRVKSATPLDLIINYLDATHKCCGSINDIVWDAIRSHDPERTSGDHISDNALRGHVPVIPDGIYRMAKSYLVRRFWKNVKYLIDSRNLNYASYGTIYDPHANSTMARLYPKDVITVLGSLHINSNCNLWDARNAIANLHAVVTPTMFDTPKWATWRNCCDRLGSSTVNRTQDLMAIGTPQARNIASLWCILTNYIWRNSDSQKDIPNDAEKEILLNLIEIFVIMFSGNISFNDAYRFRQTYEYARIGSYMGTTNVYVPYEGRRNFLGLIRYSRTYNNEFVSTVVDALKHMSPEAALCINTLDRNWCGGARRWYGDGQEKLLMELNPAPINEVKVFLNTEFNIQIKKADAIKRVLEDLASGQLNRIPGYRGCGDAKCPEPCEPCPEAC